MRRSPVRVRPQAPKCVDERCSTENTARKCGVFCIFNAVSRREKFEKTLFSENQFFHARDDISEMQQSALMDLCDLNTEAKKKIKNKKAGRRSAPHVGENGGLFRYIGAYVAFALFVYHSLVVLVIAFTGSFGYACVTKNEEVSENGNH